MTLTAITEADHLPSNAQASEPVVTKRQPSVGKLERIWEQAAISC